MELFSPRAASVGTSFFPVIKQFDLHSRGAGSLFASKHASSNPPHCHTVADEQSPGQLCWQLLAVFFQGESCWFLVLNGGLAFVGRTLTTWLGDVHLTAELSQSNGSRWQRQLCPSSTGLADLWRQLTSLAQRSGLGMLLNVSSDVRMKQFLKNNLWWLK